MENILEKYFEMVEKYPDCIAICDDSIKYTYRETYKISRNIAQYIIKKNKNNKFIGVIGNKDAKSILIILGIIQAGYAYLPIDLNYPQERINYIIKNSNLNFIISADKVEIYENCFIKSFEDIMNEVNYEYAIIKTKQIQNNDECYIIYTSGTISNQPNGVIVSHKSIINTIEWRINFYDYKVGDSILLFASLSFDSSVEDIFSALSTGAKLIIADDRKKIDPRYIADVIQKNKITYMMLVPSVYKLFISTIPEALKKLKAVILAGENVSEILVNEHYDKCKDVRLFNEYGPTENSVCSTCGLLIKGEKVHIGKPIDNVYYYLIDEEGNETQNIGELILYGEGIANGYLKNETLTRIKFIYCNKNGKIAYKTGDIVSKNVNGTLSFLGRKDNQVKINGIRINLDEITNACKKELKDIIDIYAIGYMDNEKEKIGLFYISKGKVSEKKIKNTLIHNTINHIMPSFIMELNEFKYLPNNKLDINYLKSILNASLK